MNATPSRNKPLSLAVLLALILGAAPLAAFATLGKPSVLKAGNGLVPTFSWTAVPGAGMYRLAVFDAGGLSGRAPLLAAEWIQGTSWTYGVGAAVPKVGGLLSTQAKPLTPGSRLHVMVRATDAEGGSAGQWTSINFIFKPEAPLPSASASAPVRSTATASVPAGSPAPEAELELQGGPEFNNTTASSEITLDAMSDSSAAAAPSSASPSPTPAGTPTLAGAKALLKAGRNDDAETVFRALTDKDPSDAEAWEGLGDSFRARLMKVEAADCYQRALKLDPSRQELKTWLDENTRN